MVRLYAPGAVLLLLLTGAALRSGEFNAAGADWPQFRGPNRDGISRETGLLKRWPNAGPNLVWKAEQLGVGFSSASVVGNRIFTMGDRRDGCYVIALDRATGKELWAAKVGRTGGNYAGPRCTPSWDDGLVFALGQHGDLACLDAATGAERWHKSLPKDFGGQSGGWNYTESPLVDGEKLVCTPGGSQATMLALNKKTGAVVWKCPVPDGDTAGYASIVVAEAGGIRHYVQLTADGLVGVRASDGKFLWKYGDSRERFAGNTANIPNPIVLGDHIFSAAGYGRGGALVRLAPHADGIRAEEVYFNRQLTNKHGGVVKVGDYLYGDRDDSGYPFCAEAKTGKIVWRREQRGSGSGSACVVYADGHLYFRYSDGYVALVPASPRGYAEVSAFKIPNSDRDSWNHPVVAGGRLYLRDKDILWCYAVKAK
jgi:outer membrane protein assembly factor BamB